MLDAAFQRVIPYAVGAFEFASNVGDAASRALRQAARGDGAASRPPPPLDMEADTVVITGGNAGLGEALAVEVAARGAAVVLACRDPVRAAAAAQRVAAAAAARRAGAGGRVGRVSTAKVDLTSLASAAALGTALARDRPTALVCNAGVMAPAEATTTGDGLDGQWQANFLSHWHLVSTYLTAVRRPGGGTDRPHGTRIVFLSSVTHRGGALAPSALAAAAAAPTVAAARALAPARPGFGGYADSKLACASAARELQRRFDREKGGPCAHPPRADVAVSVHPGLVDTALARGWLTGRDLWGPFTPLLAPLAAAMAPVLLKRVDDAVADVLFAVTAPATLVAGCHTAGGRVVTPSRAARDPVVGHALAAAAAAWTQAALPACLY